MKEYLDFNLEIRKGADGPQDYAVEVDSPGGQALEVMHFPFDDWELQNKLLALENALLRSGGSRRDISLDEQTVQDFGERLFKAVLTGDVRTRYEISLQEASQQNKGLRLKLRIQPPKLALLPWEFLYDSDSGEYLCFSSGTPLVRYVDLGRPVEQLPVTTPLRILGMVASPTDLPQLNVDHEKRLVEEAIKVLTAKGLVELTWLEEQTWSALQEAMWGGPWHIFHFVGHGDFDENNGEGRMAFSDETGRQVVLPARSLARLLDDHRDLRLVFLNSCEGAKGSAGDPFSGTAATLVRRGVPAVVAMQYQITDNAAITFSRAFYHAVANNLPVDAAVAAARTALSMYSTLEWGTPVLYMRSPDGCLFDIKEEEIPLGPYREDERTSWTARELHERRAEKVRNIAGNELSLNPSAAADMEREVTGETKEAVLKRQELDDLYVRARSLYRDREWQAVADVFDRIYTIDPAYPDPEELRASAREALASPPQTTLTDSPARSHREQGEQSRKGRRQIIMAVSFAALALVVVASLVLVASLPNNNNDNTPPIEARRNIFSTGFSETSTGWDQTKENLYGSYLEKGRYRMYITNGKSGSTRWSLSSVQVPDEGATVEVDATRTSDAPSASSSNWGIICRGSSGAGSGYLIGISDAGYPIIQRLKDGTFTTLAKKPSYDGYAIQKDGATNHIRGDCVGSKLTLYVNDQKVLEASDAALDSGNVGLYVQDTGHKPPGTDVFFDNFLVSEP